MKIGILAVQGAFAEHKTRLEKLGANCFEIRNKADLEQSFDGFVLPGGESTVQGKLLRELGMFDDLKNQLAMSFHPELNENDVVYEYFLKNLLTY